MPVVTELLLLIQNAQRLDSEIIYDRDFDYDYFGFKVIESEILLHIFTPRRNKKHHH